MNRKTVRDVFPESTAKKWSWIECTLSDLATSIGLSAKWHGDEGNSHFHAEIADTLGELERHLQDLFATEAEWWSKVIARLTFRQRPEASLNSMAEKRRKLLGEVNGLLEMSKFVASGSEWEELALSVEYVRTCLAEYRSLEVQVARSLDKPSLDPVEQKTPRVAITTSGKADDLFVTHLDKVPDHDGEEDLDEPRRHPRPR